MGETAFPLRLWRATRLLWVLVRGVLTILFVFPFCSLPTRRRLKMRWSADLIGALAIQVEADLRQAVPGCLIVANHISWLDIFALNAVQPCAFIAKADVRQWPVIGWLAAHNDTVFLRRGSRGHARIINEEIAARLADGQYIGLFPEGTTTDGTHVLPFHAALIQPALAAGRPVVPVAVAYYEANGERSLAPRYDGDITMIECIRAVLARPRLIARITACAPLGLAGEDRRTVAAEARRAIIAAAGLPPLAEETKTEDAA